jgi:hypothetical protein
MRLPNRQHVLRSPADHDATAAQLEQLAAKSAEARGLIDRAAERQEALAAAEAALSFYVPHKMAKESIPVT